MHHWSDCELAVVACQFFSDAYIAERYTIFRVTEISIGFVSVVHEPALVGIQDDARWIAWMRVGIAFEELPDVPRLAFDIVK